MPKATHWHGDWSASGKPSQNCDRVYRMQACLLTASFQPLRVGPRIIQLPCPVRRLSFIPGYVWPYALHQVGALELHKCCNFSEQMSGLQKHRHAHGSLIRTFGVPMDKRLEPRWQAPYRGALGSSRLTSVLLLHDSIAWPAVGSTRNFALCCAHKVAKMIG